MNDVAIKVENVSKTFKLPHSKNDSIKSKLISIKDRERGYEIQQALKDISFEVKKGEFFGIVGRNGSGKSTLLKLISGIYTPDSGGIQVNGKLTPFIELGVGFNPELSGRENVFLNGALLGFNRKEMEAMYDEIVAFAELERFMDQKLKNYSSGMQVRLAFSIAIQADTDILVLDEVLAVGDAAFQQKCTDYFEQVKQSGKTIILVTHSMDSVEKFCSRALLIHDSKVVYEGDPLVVSAKYQLLNMRGRKLDSGDDVETTGEKVQIESVDIEGEAAYDVPQKNRHITVRLECKSKVAQKLIAGISVIKNDGTYIAYFNTEASLGHISTKKNEKTSIVCRLDTGVLLKGMYVLDVALYDTKMKYLDAKGSAASFTINDKVESRGGSVNLPGSWKVE
jgi:ABC-2 type transport system ATP-binding protein